MHNEYIFLPSVMSHIAYANVENSLTRIRLHRFQHNFNCQNPTCRCLMEDESNTHFFMRCPFYTAIRINLLGNISTIIGSDISVLPADHLTDILLFGSNVYSNITNKLILLQTIEFIRKSKRFDIPEAFSSQSFRLLTTCSPHAFTASQIVRYHFIFVSFPSCVCA